MDEVKEKTDADITQTDENRAESKEGEELSNPEYAEDIEGGISDGEESGNEPTARVSSYGDLIIEGFSAEHNMERVAKVTKMSKNTASYVISAIYLVLGALCVSITGIIAEVLPYIVSSMMILIGAVRFIIALVRREYREIKTNQTATSFLVLALGIMILVQELDSTNDSAIMLIAVVWGILGLFEGAHAFNHAFHRIANSERCAYYIIKGLLECVVAFMLLYRPDSHEIHHFHIIVFGANLIMDAITMLPPVKKLLTNV
ncbi:MAG: DUF308 domain-containing protein [Clostridiales bacterium]|nr:DUF308 domain-containing protein [Clostridiales bacterium]